MSSPRKLTRKELLNRAQVHIAEMDWSQLYGDRFAQDHWSEENELAYAATLMLIVSLLRKAAKATP